MSGLRTYINQDKLKDYNPIYILEIDEFDRDYRTITRTYRYLTNDPDAEYFNEEYEEWSGYSYFKTNKLIEFENRRVEQTSQWSFPNILLLNQFPIRCIAKIVNEDCEVNDHDHTYDLGKFNPNMKAIFYKSRREISIICPNEDVLIINGDEINIKELSLGTTFFDIIRPYLEEILKLDIKLNDDDVIFIRDKV